MNTSTTAAIEPPYVTDNECPHRTSNNLFVIAFFLTVFLMFTITYACYFFKRSRSPLPPPNLSFGRVTITNYDEAHDNQLLRFSRGLDDDVLLAFPMFIYSDATIAQKGDNAMTTIDTKCLPSGCSICLADYKQADVVRLLPECRHLFHVKCIDTWLKVHPTCPVCRNSPLAGFVAVSIQGS
uniref:putative RING-H2 finger protein ATL71 n=1 Tax=Erigeron canadensis TaxID=72917 RepID=UPI001CB914B6|nr:putative RING-H2 finger protein ATL71 [Erigeron canadensis]